MPSPVWEHFDKLGRQVTCKKAGCGKKFATTSTSTLAYHLRHVHKIEIELPVKMPTGSTPDVPAADTGEPQAKKLKQATISSFLNSTSLEAYVAELVSKDGLTINQIAGSQILRELLKAKFPNQTALGKSFHENLIKKFNERRNFPLNSLAMYLFDREALSKSNRQSNPLKTANITDVNKFALSLQERLYPSAENSPLQTAEIVSTSAENLSFAEGLSQRVGNRWGKQQLSEVPETDFQKDLRVYATRQEKSPMVEKLFLALCSIPPTSTQSERNFSLAGNFVSKLRTRLTPQHVDVLCFLKSYFIERK